MLTAGGAVLDAAKRNQRDDTQVGQTGLIISLVRRCALCRRIESAAQTTPVQRAVMEAMAGMLAVRFGPPHCGGERNQRDEM